MQANRNKCHPITSEESCINLKVGNINIENSACEKLLGVKLDNKPNFNKHLDGIIKIASRKIGALSMILPFMDLRIPTGKKHPKIKLQR